MPFEANIGLRIPADELEYLNKVARDTCEEVGLPEDYAPAITRALIRNMEMYSAPTAGTGTEATED